VLATHNILDRTDRDETLILLSVEISQFCDDSQTRYHVEMSIQSVYRKTHFERRRCDPDVIRWYRFADRAQLRS
jgi:hypothetical protein